MKVDLDWLIKADLRDVGTVASLALVFQELRAAREVVSYAAALMSEEDAFNAVSQFNVAFGFLVAPNPYACSV